MRLKYYLRGLGLGIIFTVIIMMVGFKTYLKDYNNDQAETQRAEEIWGTEETDSPEMVKDNDSGAGTDGDTQNPAEADDTGNADDSQKAEDTAEPASEPVDNNTASTTTTGYVTITVSDGMMARDIAEELYARGMVDDAEEFRKYLGSTGRASYIHNGDYQLPVGSTYEQIANILIGR